ncbi:hypothetical protein [Roseovarius sp.]|uniref:hypothetical protein n=1 Tax=Roseovarius sp. TaxID=1486281 RepID=UPI003A9815E4
MNEPNTTIDLVELKGAVGSHFFVWSQFEVALAEAVSELETESSFQKTRGIAQTIKRWKQLQDGVSHPNPAHAAFIEELFSIMLEGLDIRNKIAHGTVSWSVEGDVTEAYIGADLGGEKKTIAYTTLTSMNEQLMTLRSHLSRVTSITLEPERWRHSDLYTEVRTILRRKRVK